MKNVVDVRSNVGDQSAAGGLGGREHDRRHAYGSADANNAAERRPNGAANDILFLAIERVSHGGRPDGRSSDRGGAGNDDTVVDVVGGSRDRAARGAGSGRDGRGAGDMRLEKHESEEPEIREGRTEKAKAESDNGSHVLPHGNEQLSCPTLPWKYSDPEEIRMETRSTGSIRFSV